jgi:hypothetical protein
VIGVITMWETGNSPHSINMLPELKKHLKYGDLLGQFRGKQGMAGGIAAGLSTEKSSVRGAKLKCNSVAEV